MSVKFRIAGTQSLALAKSRILTGYLCAGAHAQQHVLPGSLPPQQFLEQRQSPEAGWVTGKSWSETVGGSGELTVSTRTKRTR